MMELLGAVLPRVEFAKGEAAVELGSGTGVVGLLAASVSNLTTVHLSDLPALVPLLQRNAARASIASVSVDSLLWATAGWPAWLSRFPRLLICSDVLYDKAAVPLFLQTAVQLSDERTVVLISYKRRYVDREVPFLDELQRWFHLFCIPAHALPCARAAAAKGLSLLLAQRRVETQGSLLSLLPAPVVRSVADYLSEEEGRAIGCVNRYWKLATRSAEVYGGWKKREKK
eukprot:PLAT8442.3.p1 GENE.PLAT8442.3~~PLAT8442.3.p1  ORF type:complete len:247 (-),score=51.69 PLAT8442.3:64-750(-)